MSNSLRLWTAARQASLSITNSQNLLKLMSTESVMPSNHFMLCCPLHLPLSILPSIRVFSNESVFASGGQSTGVSAWRPNVYLDLCSLNLTTTYLAYKSNAESSTVFLILKEKGFFGTSLEVQSLKLWAPSVWGPGLISGRGTRPHVLQLKHPTWHSENQRSCVAQLKDPVCFS